MDRRATHLAAAALLSAALVIMAGVPASAVDARGKCLVLSLHKYRGPKVVPRGSWITKVRIKNAAAFTELIRGVWHVRPPYHRHFKLRARLKPGEGAEASFFLGKGGGRPTIELLGCYPKAPDPGH